MPNKIRLVNSSLEKLSCGCASNRMIDGCSGKSEKINRRMRREGRSEEEGRVERGSRKKGK